MKIQEQRKHQMAFNDGAEAPKEIGLKKATDPLARAVPLRMGLQQSIKTNRGELESKKATEEHEYFRFHSVNTNVRKHVPFTHRLPLRFKLHPKLKD